jgi:hypothetical protein
MLLLRLNKIQQNHFWHGAMILPRALQKCMAAYGARALPACKYRRDTGTPARFSCVAVRFVHGWLAYTAAV